MADIPTYFLLTWSSLLLLAVSLASATAQYLRSQRAAAVTVARRSGNR